MDLPKPDIGALCWLQANRKSLIIPRAPVMVMRRTIERIRFAVIRIDTCDAQYEGIWPWELKIMAPLEQLAWASVDIETLLDRFFGQQ